MKLRFQMVGSGSPVPGQDDGAQSFLAQIVHDSAGLGADIVPQDDAPEQVPFGKPNFRKTCVRGCKLGDGCRVASLRQPFAPAKLARIKTMPSANAQPGNGFKLVEVQQRKLLVLAI